MIKRTFIKIVLIAALSCICVNMAQAWNDTGHMVIAHLAYDHLTPKAKHNLAALLAKHRDYALWMHEMPAGFTDKALYAFMRSATWPDAIRKTPDDRPNWHYIDVPIVFPSAGFHPDPATIPVPVPNAEVALSAESQHLASFVTSDSDKAVAICWIAHLIGDLHQPLHCATQFSAVFPHGDRGGNDLVVPDREVPDVLIQANTYKKAFKLHTIWDDLIGVDKRPEAIELLAATLRTSAYRRSAFPELSQDQSVDTWISEGTILCRKSVYLDGNLKQTVSPSETSPGVIVTVDLPSNYITDSAKIADQQAAKAGYRLADTLNTLLGF